jgi:hypothetical protein
MLERKRAEEERRREQQRRQAAAKAAADAKRLDDLAAEEDAPWKRVDEMIAAKKTSEYDLADAGGALAELSRESLVRGGSRG